MKVVCIGDSITAGQYVPPGFGWVEILGYENRGVPGDTTRLGLERFPRDVQESGADVVLIQFGHNDANRWQTDRWLPRVSLDAFKANLSEMIDRVRRFDGWPVIIGLTNPDRVELYVETCKVYDRAAHEIARENIVEWCDMWPHFTPDHYLSDGLHLNEKGHGIYAEQVRNAIPVAV